MSPEITPCLANSACSFNCAICVSCFALAAFLSIPLSPDNAPIVTAANISKIIIVITNAINVIFL